MGSVGELACGRVAERIAKEAAVERALETIGTRGVRRLASGVSIRDSMLHAARATLGEAQTEKKRKEGAQAAGGGESGEKQQAKDAVQTGNGRGERSEEGAERHEGEAMRVRGRRGAHGCDAKDWRLPRSMKGAQKVRGHLGARQRSQEVGVMVGVCVCVSFQSPSCCAASWTASPPVP